MISTGDVGKVWSKLNGMGATVTLRQLIDALEYVVGIDINQEPDQPHIFSAGKGDRGQLIDANGKPVDGYVMEANTQTGQVVRALADPTGKIQWNGLAGIPYTETILFPAPLKFVPEV